MRTGGPGTARSLITPARLVFGLALLVRLTAVLAGRHLGIGLDDMFQYDMLARSLATGQGFRWYAAADVALIQRYLDFDPTTHPAYDPRGLLTSFRAPLYPAFLAVFYRLAGPEARWFAARLAQAVVGALAAPLTWALARALLPRRPRAALAAASIVAVYPMLVLLPLALATENLFLPLSLGLLNLLVRGPRPGRARGWALQAGGVLGLAMLTRSVAAVFVPLVVLRAWRATAREPLRTRWQAPALAVLALAALTGPWLVRNARLHGRWVWLETSGGYNLYIGAHPQGDGTFYPPAAQELLVVVDDAERDALARRRAWAFIRQAGPVEFARRVLRRTAAFYGLETRVFMYLYSNGVLGAWPRPVLLAVLTVWLTPFPVLMLLAARTWAHGPRGPGWAWAAAFALAYTLPHALILADPRMHLALVPLVAVAAVWTVAYRAQWRAVEATPRGRWRAWAGWAAQAVLLAGWGAGLWAQRARWRVLLGPRGHEAHFDY